VFPPGQKARDDFPRFGLPQYASRFPSNIDSLTIEIEIDKAGVKEIDISSAELPRCTVKSDFHCVTTWSYIGAEWGGLRFSDFYSKFVVQSEANSKQITGAVFYAQDGAKTSLELEDLLGGDVLLADTLDDKPLSIEHGAPIRLVAPAHYGYKNLKHLAKIEFYSNMPVVKRGIDAFLDHPRARVAKEERGRWIPGWILRYIYRLLVSGTVKDFKLAMQEYKGDTR